MHVRFALARFPRAQVHFVNIYRRGAIIFRVDAKALCRFFAPSFVVPLVLLYVVNDGSCVLERFRGEGKRVCLHVNAVSAYYLILVFVAFKPDAAHELRLPYAGIFVLTHRNGIAPIVKITAEENAVCVWCPNAKDIFVNTVFFRGVYAEIIVGVCVCSLAKKVWRQVVFIIFHFIKPSVHHFFTNYPNIL